MHRLQFTADQVTQEKTGVQVTGLAVFRVVEPELAWRVLDQGHPGAVADILREMCVGATRRLVANLSLEDCLTRRKEALSDELMAEVAPVVRGRGRQEDHPDAGWGIAIDTIEIQDVKIQSSEVFRRLQAPYREGLALTALAAEAEVAQERARLEEERRTQEEIRRRELMVLVEERVKAERVRAQQAADHEASLALKQTEAAVAVAAREQEARLERERQEVEARGAWEELDAQSRRRRAEVEAETLRVQRAAEAETVAQLRAAQDQISDARLAELVLTETLPRMAESLSVTPDTAIFTGEAHPTTTGLVQLVATMGQLGITLPGMTN